MTSQNESPNATSNRSATSAGSISTDPADANADGTISAEERMAFAYQQLMAALQRMGEAASKNESVSPVSVTSGADVWCRSHGRCQMQPSNGSWHSPVYH